MKKLVLIDGKSVFYRGYYAMPNLSTGDGTPTGGVYGFAALALEMMKQIKPDYVAVAWDKPKTNIRKRLAIYPEYKAGRKPAPADFYTQIPILHELLDAFGWPLYEFDDYEADDIMATLDNQAESHGELVTYLITSDLDALQILDKNTFLYALKKGFSNIEKFDVAGFEAKYGIRIDQFLDLKSLKGDSSDNIPGVPGIGEKTAVQLLQKYETLEGVYENLWEIKDATRRKLEQGKDSAFMSRELARLFTDAPVSLDLEALDVTKLDTTRLHELLTKLEFKSLLRSLPSYMQQSGSSGSQSVSLEPAKLESQQPGDVKTGLFTATHDTEALYLSPQKGVAYKFAPSELAALTHINLIVHDGDEFLHWWLQSSDRFATVSHDTKQVAFLIDPLRKSRGLGDLVDADVSDPLVALEAIRSIYDEQAARLEELPRLRKVAYDIDIPLIPMLARMESRGIKLDKKQLAAMDGELSEEINDLQNAIWEDAGEEFNIASPSQLAGVLYEKLGLPTLSIKKGKTGFSTGQRELDKLRGAHPIVERIEKYRELTKLQSTYVRALPETVAADGRIHSTFNQDVAATGRLSSTDPNLQNIPVRSELGKKIREAFIPDEGNVFVAADYSQFELRLAAALAGDEDMINTFNSGTDIHTKTAAEVYNVPLDDVTPDMRRHAKVINFGVLYGMSPHGLSAATGMSFTEAKSFIDEYFRVRTPIRTYIDKTIHQAKTEGYVETYFGRRRPTPDIHSSNFIVRQGAERQAANMPIQGTEADLMKMAMLRVETLLQEDESLGKQILQIHDSIMIECPESSADRVGKMLKETMEDICPELKVKLNVDVKQGKNWGEL